MARVQELGNIALMGGSLDPWEASLYARCLSAGSHVPQLGWMLGGHGVEIGGSRRGGNMTLFWGNQSS